MLIKNIIWDWNGTIVDDAWVFVAIMNNLLKKEGLPQTDLQYYRKNFCFPIQDYWKGLGFEFTEKSFNGLNASFIQEYQKKMFLPSLHENINSLFVDLNKKNIKQFVLSASENNLLQNSIEHYNLKGVFKGVYGVDNLNATGKESLGTLLFSKYKLDPSETLLIGDTEYDCRVAEHLGCDIILLSHGHVSCDRLLCCGVPVLSSLRELEEYLTLNQ